MSNEIIESTTSTTESISEDKLAQMLELADNLQSDSNDKDYIEDNVLLLDTSNVSEVVFDKKAFIEGVRDVSKLCGQIAALCNVGITPTMALSYLSEKESSDKIAEYNFKISELNANANIESARFNGASMQKMMM